jgi:hypothetical protein
MSISASGAVTTTGVISGSNALSASFSLNSALLNGTGSVGFATTGALLEVSSSQQQISASLLQVSASYIALSGSYNTFSGSASTRVTKIENNYATTGSNSFRADQSITGSLVVSSTITAQTLVVQTVTSSIVYSSGSNIFGSQLTNTQTFTGSIYQTGSIAAFAGSVGIGTTNPTSPLTLSSTSANLAFYNTFNNAQIRNWAIVMNYNNLGDMSFLQSTAQNGNPVTAGTARLHLNYDGNVGIGTTSPLTSLTIKSTNDNGYGLTRPSDGTVYHWKLSTTETGSDSYTVAYNTYNNDAVFTTYAGGGTGGNIILRTGATSGTITERMRINSSGSVGIGTTSPTSRLHIINNTDGFVGRFTGGAASTVTAGIYANSTTGFASIGVQSAHQFRIFTSDADRLTVTSDGNIGIGTISPTQKFHIVGTTGLPASSGTSQPGTLRLQLSGYGTVLDFGGEGPATGKQWIQATDASSLAYTYPLLLNPNGGVVIVGTSISSGYGVFNTYKLPVSSNYVDQIIVQGTGNYPSLRLGTYDLYDGVVATTGNDLRILSGLNVTTENHNIMFYTSFNGGTTGAQNYERMRIAYTGNVGIGSATPGAKLDIVASAPYVFRVTNNGSASGNNPTAQFLNQYGDHSWGICAEFRTGGSGAGTDRSSILFSNGYDTNTWGCGFGYNDSSYFRINKDQGPYGGGWGTTLLSIDRSGNYSFPGSNVSDRRNKKDITYIEDSQLSIILKLKPASFNKKSPGKDEYSDHVHTGFIAQDVLESGVPNLVHGNEEDGYGLDYDGILALTVKAIQELKLENDSLKEILQRNNIN